MKQESLQQQKSHTTLTYKVQFQVPQIRKQLDLNMQGRSNIKSQKLILSQKMDYDFAHFDIRAFYREIVEKKEVKRQQISVTEHIEQISCFKDQKAIYIVQIRFVYE